MASQKNHTASDVTEPRSFGPLTEEDSSQFASRHGFAMRCPPRRTDCARMSLSSGLHLCSVIAGISTLDMAFSSTPKNLDYLAESNDISGQRCKQHSTLVVERGQTLAAW